MREANFRYYEPRTEHGSSLSGCIYALAAAKCGLMDYAYDYFMQAATLDLAGAYKRLVGDLYIGGTHPASNGGSWLVAVPGLRRTFSGGRGAPHPAGPAQGMDGADLPAVLSGPAVPRHGDAPQRHGDRRQRQQG